MTRISIEERIRAIQEVEGGESIVRVAKRYQINNDYLSQSIKQFREYGVEGLTCHAYHWPAEQKYYVLKYMTDNQLSRKETAIKFRISGSSIICNWERRYLEKGMSGLEDKNKGRKPKTPKPKPPKTKEEELQAEILYLRAENEYLKKLNALVAEREKLEKETK